MRGRLGGLPSSPCWCCFRGPWGGGSAGVWLFSQRWPWASWHCPSGPSEGGHALSRCSSSSSSSLSAGTGPFSCRTAALSPRDYAESVGRKVRDLGMMVDLIFLNSEMSLQQALDDVSRGGSPFAIVITQQHQVHHSCTVNIMFGTPQGRNGLNRALAGGAAAAPSISGSCSAPRGQNCPQSALRVSEHQGGWDPEDLLLVGTLEKA